MGRQQAWHPHQKLAHYRNGCAYFDSLSYHRGRAETLISRTDLANGFANRFLFALIKRSKELPFGGNLTDSEILHLGTQVGQIIEAARGIGRVTWTNDAAAEWARVYSALSAGQSGLLGAITARAEAQVIRLATLYALLDNSTRIEVAHLKAGWRYGNIARLRPPIFSGTHSAIRLPTKFCARCGSRGRHDEDRHSRPVRAQSIC